MTYLSSASKPIGDNKIDHTPWLSKPEPDVTWGEGGIDDWGWTTQPALGSEPETTSKTTNRKPATSPTGRSNP